MAPGPSSVISKAVIEDFAPKFLLQPAVIFLSESRDKVVARDDELAKSIGLRIPAQTLLPDILLVDLGVDPPLLVFVEVVASDGPITDARKQSLSDLVATAGFDPRHVAFVTAFRDKGDPAFRKAASDIAWQTFTWFAAEPDAILSFQRLSTFPVALATLLRSHS